MKDNIQQDNIQQDSKPTAFPSIAVNVGFHDALRDCVDAHTFVNATEPDDPNRAIHEYSADVATERLAETIDGIFARRLALAQGMKNGSEATVRTAAVSGWENRDWQGRDE